MCAHPDEIRAIYKRVSGSEKPADWYPLQVVCEKCGKVGSTKVIGFDGKEAEYVCEPAQVKWAEGCGYHGKVAPWDGVGKVPWKVEWAVKWAGCPRPDGGHGVDIEGSGKDHNAAGGSHDVSEAICREVLQAPVPFNIPYEFFLFGGAKMSASKGMGATAKEVSDMMPPELLRFLMVRTRPNQPIEFSMDGDVVPRLYDNHDECGNIYFASRRGENPDNIDLGKAYYYSELGPVDGTPLAERFFPRFSQVAFMVQIPHIDAMKEIEGLKGASLTQEDRTEAKNRIEYAQVWLERFADESAKFEIQETIPDRVRYELNDNQKSLLAALAKFLRENPEAVGQDIHNHIHELRQSSPLDSRAAFSSIYLPLLNKNSGPQAGWFLAALDRAFVVDRFQSVSELPTEEKPAASDAIAPSKGAPMIIIRSDVCERFPGIKLGFNTLQNVQIKSEDPALESLRQELWRGLDFEDLKSNSPRLEAFREIYRGFGVKPSNNKPSPVALISRLANGKPLPNINTAVDIYNAVAVKHQLAIGLFDLDKLTLPVELAFAAGGEIFHPLTGDKPGPLMPGELCYFDANGLVMARDFNYLDSDLAKVTPDTKNLLLNVDGNQACTLGDVEACLAELETLLQQFGGGTLGERVLISAS